MPTSITINAYAKINLALAVGAPLPPGTPDGKAGFHPIASWMTCIDLADELTLSRLNPDGSGRYTIEWSPDAPRASPIDWPLEKDLAVRAHRLLEAEVGRPLPLSMVMRKRVPVGGGLGGGSSDGAAMLLGVRRLFSLNIPTSRLVALSARLGSDMAFFVDDDQPARPALVTGLGDRLERVTHVDANVLLIVPPVGCPTGPVYRAYDRSPRELRENDVRELIAQSTRDGRIDSHGLFNDLASPACEVEPRVGDVMQRIKMLTTLPLHMTGSGSTLFMLGSTVEEAAELERVASTIASEMREVVCVQTTVGGGKKI